MSAFIQKTAICIAICVFVCSQMAVAQPDDEIKTVFDGRLQNVSAYLGFGVSFTKMNDQFAYISKGEGGLIVNNSLNIGGYGMALTSAMRSNATDVQYANAKVLLSSGGLKFGYIVSPMKIIHLHPAVMAGVGTIQLTDKDLLNKHKIYHIAPVLELEMNVTKFLRVGVGGDYNVFWGIENTEILSGEQFNKASFYMSFRFGWFPGFDL